MRALNLKFKLSEEDLLELQKKALMGKPVSFDEARRFFWLNDEQALKSLFNMARNAANRHQGKRINFYYTSKYFPSVSITGVYCALNCKHCQKKLLKGLIPATTPKKFIEICKKLMGLGAKGILISGGCLMNGNLPIDKFSDAIVEVKKKTNLILIAHTGLLDFNEAKKLVDAGLDGAAVDIVGSSQTTKAIYGIEISPENYAYTLKALERAKIPIISPHVCVGLHFGELKGELESLRIISRVKPTTIVIIALMPLRDTPLENVKPSPTDVAKVIAITKLMFPDVPLTLGCARSKGTDRELIDELAIRAGITNIAIPTKRAIETALSLKMEIQCYSACCAVPPLPSLRIPLSEIYGAELEGR